MPFPISPDEPADENGLILVQDPSLRSRIMPLFRFNPQRRDERVVGQGTTFRIDPWGTCLTAFHVIEELLEHDHDRPGQATLKADIRLAALELESVGYRIGSISKDRWRPFSSLNAPCIREHIAPALPTMRSLAEIAVLGIEYSLGDANKTSFLKLDLRRWRPQQGDLVLALGFPGLDEADETAPDDRPVEQYMYGSFGRILDIERPDPSRGRPWPMLRIDAHWPGGMSGGPVFNEEGHVIGLVSAGEAFTSTATHFSAWPLPPQMMPNLDPDNPGWLRGYAVLNGKDDVVKFGPHREPLEAWARDNGGRGPLAVSFNPDDGGWATI